MAESVKGPLKTASDSIKEAKGKPMKPSQCHKHMQKELAAVFEEITKGFLDEAKKGSCQHVKLAMELVKPVEKKASRKKGPVTKFYEQWERERPERERLQQEQALIV